MDDFKHIGDIIPDVLEVTKALQELDPKVRQSMGNMMDACNIGQPLDYFLNNWSIQMSEGDEVPITMLIVVGPKEDITTIATLMVAAPENNATELFAQAMAIGLFKIAVVTREGIAVPDRYTILTSELDRNEACECIAAPPAYIIKPLSKKWG